MNLFKVKISIPIHITGFWTICRHEDELRTGSMGAGLVLKPRVNITAEYGEEEEIKVLFNGKSFHACFLDYVLTSYNLQNVRIYIGSPMDLGLGYGLSGAISLGTSLSLETLSSIVNRKPLNPYAAGQVAHVAEVKCSTGLGDVIAEFYGGGLEVRVKPGAPDVGEVVFIPVTRDIHVLTFSLPGRFMTTPEMLTKYRDKIIMYGSEVLKKLLDNPCIEEFVCLSNYFSAKVGMLSLDARSFIDEAIKPYRNNVVGYYVKKNLCVIVCDESISRELMEHLKHRYSLDVSLHEIEYNGWRLEYIEKPN